jgi:hypothetical protein
MTPLTPEQEGLGGLNPQHERLDHGLLNVPLAKRGSLDRQIDKSKFDEARYKKWEAAMYQKAHRERMCLIREYLDALSDERVLELGQRLGKRNPSTARKALYQQAGHDSRRWLDALFLEIGQQNIDRGKSPASPPEQGEGV